MKTTFVAMLAVALLANAAFAEIIRVPATANPWLAGMTNGSTARRGDSAPEESPIALTNTVIEGGAIYVFSASGSANHGATLSFFPPEGENYIASHYLGPENGIADIATPYTGLVGVFLDLSQPDQTPAPQPLDFGTVESRDCLMLKPALKQPFFIGTGSTASGTAKQIVAPPGATRLLLGIMDEYNWADTQARIMQSWTYESLNNKATFVVIAIPKKVTATSECAALPNIRSGTNDVIGVGIETEFEILTVLKGDHGIKTCVLHHYKLADTKTMVISGPELVSFEPKDKKVYLLFLQQEADGRFAAVSGQTDPFWSVMEFSGQLPNLLHPDLDHAKSGSF